MPVAGWYADPTAQGRLRWWDGQGWTGHVQASPHGASLPQTGGPQPQVGWVPPQLGGEQMQAWPQQQATWPPAAPVDVFGMPDNRPRTADGVPLAGWWARARGYLVDSMMLWAVSMVLFEHWHGPLFNELLGLWRVWLLVGLGPGGLQDWFTADLLGIWVRAMIPGVLLRVAYDVACLSTGGATLGHRAAGLRVARRDAALADGPRTGLRWTTALVRSLVVRLTAPTFVLWLVVVLWAAVDRRRQGLHDRLAGTQVVDHQWARAGMR
ncbi:RDD family protein [Luteococcus peritonei]|uniref:RDD family protein n=1 Tax=Luteococcus peritonei TaxID=88874 RepID=A0ABW4RVU7_9ACTN